MSRATSKVRLWPCSAGTSPKWRFIDCTLRKPPLVIRQPIRSHGPRIMGCIDPIKWRSPGVFFHTWSLSRVELFCSAQSWVVFSNMLYFHHFLMEDFQFDSYFPTRLKPPTRKVSYLSLLFFSVCPTDHAGCAGMSHVKTSCLVRELIRERRPQAAWTALA